jgi:acyl carrier protein
MGLDAVELVLRIEDEFSISLPDDEISAVRTVGDLYQIVLSKLDTTPSCLTSKAFYRTRQALVDSTHVARRAVRPSTQLEGLLPEKSRIATWSEMEKRIALQMPTLMHSSMWKERFRKISAVAAAGLALAAYFAGRMWFRYTASAAPVFAILFGLILAFLIDRWLLGLTPTLAVEMPVTTAGELARMILTLNHEEFAPAAAEGTVPSKEYVWTRIVRVFCDQLQVSPEEVVPEARIIEDLGVD